LKENTYNEYIKHEKYYSNIFLRTNHIFEERFFKDEYTIIKKLWSNQELVDNIFVVIDNILNSIKMPNNVRYLIFSDFIFSLNIYTMSDSLEIFLKTSRNNYISNIHTRARINILFGCDFYDYVHIHKKLLIGLRQNKIIKRDFIRNKNKKGWETLVYLSLSIKIDFLNDKFYGISSVPFIISNYMSNYSISSFRNIWKIKRKKREMEEYLNPIDSIITANNIKFILSADLLKINYSIIKQEEKKLLTQNNCTNFNDYLEKILKMIKDKKILNNLKNDDCINHLKIEYNEFIKNFQKIFSINLLNKNIFNICFYLPCFADNRTRQYYGTIFSPTFSILYRYLYEFYIKKEFVSLEESKFYNKIISYKNIVNDFKLDDKKSYILIILLIEIGKHFINNNNHHIVKTKDTIENGIKNYKEKNIEITFDKLLYINKIYFLIDSLLYNTDFNYNSLIYKDATASGIMNYGILLKYKNEKLEYLNINNEDWCDTYQYLINTYLKDPTNSLSNRKLWKGTLMTIPYNATWYGCFTNFITNLRKNGIEYRDMSNADKEVYKQIHKNFYDSIKKYIKKEFYKNDNTDKLVIFKYNKWIIVNKKDYKINYNNLRDKYTDILYMHDYDEKNTLRALEANNMHLLDAQLVKHVLKKFDVVSIHDCFGIRLSELHLVMDYINKYYSDIIGETTYSINILR